MLFVEKSLPEYFGLEVPDDFLIYSGGAMIHLTKNNYNLVKHSERTSTISNPKNLNAQ